MSNPFENAKGNFGFGCMRLKMDGDNVDAAEFAAMADAFMEAGFNYFDTAHGYIDGKSELAIRDGLCARYPRESFVLVNKLSDWFFNSQEEIVPLFEKQLEACGTDYFDIYLIHSVNKDNYEKKYKGMNAFAEAAKLKEQGKVKHVGFSFHDKADVLDRILTEQPQTEVVQLQFNYLDYLNEDVQAKACYEVCVKHGKPVIVMEPVRGGRLVNLPKKAEKILTDMGGSPASYAIRFAASFPNVKMVLSGMGSMAMMRENTAFMKDFKPLNAAEMAAVAKVREMVESQNLIDCTGCRYCTDVCPASIPIPELFAAVNDRRQCKESSVTPDAAARCMDCGACESTCPQHLPIRTLLAQASEEL